jgi:hypothetical protein
MIRRFLGLLALLAIVAQLIVAGSKTVDRIALGLLHGATGIQDSTLEARRRIFGRAADDIEAIKRVLPQNAEYLLAGDNTRGALYFIAYDLAPRRVRNLGSGWCSEAELRTLGTPSGAPQFVVVVPSLPLPPYVIESRAFFARSHP